MSTNEVKPDPLSADEMDDANAFVELAGTVAAITAGVLVLPAVAMAWSVGRSVLVGQMRLFGSSGTTVHVLVYGAGAITALLFLRAAESLWHLRRTGTRSAIIANVALLALAVVTTVGTVIGTSRDITAGDAPEIAMIRYAALLAFNAALAVALWFLVRGTRTRDRILAAIDASK